MKEWFDSVENSAIVEDKNGSHIIFDTDSVFTLSVKELLNVLETSGDFYKNPTKENMVMILKKYVAEQIQVLRQDSDWYIRLAMPEFLKGELTDAEK